MLSYHQFNVKQVEYKSTKTQEMKMSKRTIREDIKQDVVSVYEEVKRRSQEYLVHRFQIENDRYHWRKLLSQNTEVIFHMDYSENVSGSPKYEPHDAHFSKAQFSLHCTVAHTGNSNEYLYHLSDNKKHDHNFTSSVVHDLVILYPNIIILRFKSDNCSAQYKCKNVYPIYLRLSKTLQKIIIVYYGEKGHGKGLVDAMSGFGLKNST